MELNTEVFNAKNNTQATGEITEYLKQQGVGRRARGMAREALSRAIHIYQVNFNHNKYS